MLYSVLYTIIQWRLNMSEIEMVKIRASIVIGNFPPVETPFIQSFNVRKARGQASTFDASLKVSHEDISHSNLGGDVVIYAGRDGTKKIFTGIIKKASISPCWDDPGFVFLNVSGADASSLLQGKKYTRRCRATKGTWISLDSIIRSGGLRDGKFSYDLDTVQVDPGVSHNRILEQHKTKRQGNRVGSPPKSPAPTPVLSKITAIPGTNLEENIAP